MVDKKLHARSSSGAKSRYLHCCYIILGPQAGLQADQTLNKQQALQSSSFCTIFKVRNLLTNSKKSKCLVSWYDVQPPVQLYCDLALISLCYLTCHKHSHPTSVQISPVYS